jgi:hypothetical protein
MNDSGDSRTVTIEWLLFKPGACYHKKALNLAGDIVYLTDFKRRVEYEQKK